MTTHTTPSSSPPSLRRTLRARRRAVPPHLRLMAASAIALAADQLRLLRPGRRIALYLPMPEELDTAALMKRARARGCELYLPRITDPARGLMTFVRADGPLRRGRWGILEPALTGRIATRRLEVIFMPLVGFDDRGNRMGMGKGFYDRAVAFRLRHPGIRRPRLVGIAYECQRVDALPVRAHDVPLDIVITERHVRRFTSRTPPP